MGKRELVALFSLSCCCFVMFVWLFLAVPWVCLRFVIVVFPDHNYLLFLVTNDHVSFKLAFSATETRVPRWFRILHLSSLV